MLRITSNIIDDWNQMRTLLECLKNKNLKARILQPRDELFDRVLGIKTFGYKKVDEYDLQSPHWKGDYMPTNYKTVFSLLKRVNIGSDSVVVDYGSGLGRVVFAAAYLGAKCSWGVEFDEGLYQASEVNKASFRFSNKVAFVHQDASSFKIPNDANIFFFFNPFGYATMATVIKRIEDSLDIASRKIYIVYYNARFPETFRASSKLKLQYETPEVIGKNYAIQIWKNYPAQSAAK